MKSLSPLSCCHALIGDLQPNGAMKACQRSLLHEREDVGPLEKVCFDFSCSVRGFGRAGGESRAKLFPTGLLAATRWRWWVGILLRRVR
jgi:hypothetical protein